MTIPDLSGSRPIDLASAPLREVENYIAPRLRGFVEAGSALLWIRDRRLYVQGGWDTFEIYCRQRWGIDDSHARRMVDAAQVAQITASTNAPIGAVVERESQARELAPLLADPDELKAVWEETVRRVQDTAAPLTASTIRAVRRERESARTGPPPPAPRPEPLIPAIPTPVHRVFLVITQAAEEARSLGAPRLFRGAAVNRDVLGIWAGKFEDAAVLCAELAAECRGTGVD